MTNSMRAMRWLGAIAMAWACPGYALTANEAEVLRSSVEAARLECAPKIHFDTYTFNRCIDQRLAKYHKNDIARLGTGYAGFAVALSTTRVGMPGAEESAQYFYWRYRPLQLKLGIDDATLCSSLPGDCAIRLAQTATFAKKPRTKTPRAAAQPSDDHTH